LVLRSLFDLGLLGWSMRFSPCCWPKKFDFPELSSLSLSLLFRVCPFCRRCLRLSPFEEQSGRQLPSLRFFHPSTFSQQRVATFPRVNQSLSFGAFSAFLTLSRLSSTLCLPAFFHAGAALGLLPSGLISTRRAIRSFELLSPLVVSAFPGHRSSCFFLQLAP
jgi:hypothetical protein